MTPLSSCEAIRENNTRTERECLARQEERRKRASAEAPRVAALQREFAPRMAAHSRAAEASARAAAAVAAAAAEAARTLEALNAELRETTRMAIGNDYANWHPDGFGDLFIALASRIAADASRIAGVVDGVADDAARIAASAEAFFALDNAPILDSSSGDDAANKTNDDDDDDYAPLNSPYEPLYPSTTYAYDGLRPTSL